MGDNNKVLSVKIKRGDGSVQIHPCYQRDMMMMMKLLYPLKLSLTHAHYSGTVPSSEAAGDEGVDNSDESRKSPYADNTPNVVSQRPKMNKNVKGKRNSPKVVDS